MQRTEATANHRPLWPTALIRAPTNATRASQIADTLHKRASTTLALAEECVENAFTVLESGTVSAKAMTTLVLLKSTLCEYMVNARSSSELSTANTGRLD